jgi:hypothetical protein
MKANELRIGNWIRTSKEEQAVDVLCDSLSTINQHCITYDMVAPIQLTEQWLIRFGFEKDEEFDEGGIVDYRYFLHKRNFTLSFTSNFSTEDFIYVNYNQGGVDCFFIHQLQNLYFALTGEELKLNEI